MNLQHCLEKKEESKLNIYHENYERYSHHSSRIQGEVEADLPAPTWVVASGIKGASSVTVTLAGKPAEETAQAENMKLIEEAIRERPYTVRLYFSEPEEKKPGQRVFDISIQGREVLRNFDIVKETGGPNHPVVKKFSGILVKEDLMVALTPSNNDTANVPLICGIEVTAEGW